MTAGEVTCGKQVVVLSASEDCFQHVQRLCVELQVARVEWVSDPTKLVPERSGGRSDGGYDVSEGNERVIGIILDLTDPRGEGAQGADSSPGVRARGEALLAWRIGAVLATVAVGQGLPIVLVSDNPQVESTLRWHDTLIVERVGSREGDLAWQRAIAGLLARVGHEDLSAAAQTPYQPETTASAPPAVLPLRAHLSFDAAGGRLLGPDGAIALTAREAEMLAILLHAPGVYHSSNLLARRLSHASPYGVSRQSVVQTASALRRKLGDSAQEPRLLAHRRGYGYALRPDSPQATRRRAVSAAADRALLAMSPAMVGAR